MKSNKITISRQQSLFASGFIITVMLIANISRNKNYSHSILLQKN